MRYLIFSNLIFLSLLLNGQVTLKSLQAHSAVQDAFIALNSGVRVENISFVGASEAMAYFTTSTQFLPVSKGLVLTTGNVYLINKSNLEPNSGVENYANSDLDLSNIAKGKTYDAAILKFDFYPNSDKISFNYFFASEEYPEYVNKGVNDVFAFLIRKKGERDFINIAVLPNSGKPVTVDNINATCNSNLFIKNDVWDLNTISKYAHDFEAGERSLNFAFDGLTHQLTAHAKVIPYACYEFKIAIADVGDAIFDSGVFLQKHSFKSSGEILALKDLMEDSLSINLNNQVKVRQWYDDKIDFDIPFEFEFNSIEYGKEYNVALQTLSLMLIKYFDLHIKLIGHSDIVGEEDFNLKLSKKRAQKVEDYLLQKGIAKDRIEVIGKGSSEPISDKNQQENRRVQCIVLR